MYLSKQNLIILYWVIFFNKGLKEEDKKEGRLKRLKNIEDRSEEQLKAFSKINKTSRFVKYERGYNYNHKFVFYIIYRGFERF